MEESGARTHYGGGAGREGGWGGGCTHLLLACSHVTIDHASLSRRGTVPTPSRDISNILGAHYVSSIHYMKSAFLS